MGEDEPSKSTALGAAYLVLKDAGEPLTAKQITEEMLRRGLWVTRGKTPDATVNARIAVDIKAKGSWSRFRRVRPGLFAVNK